MRSGKEVLIVYLTLDGREPPDSSRQDVPDDQLLCIGYGTFILPWLARCIEQSVRRPILRENLIQYQRVVQRLTNGAGQMDSVNESAGLLETPEQLTAAAQISLALDQKRSEIQLDYWERLQEELQSRLGLTQHDFVERWHFSRDKIEKYHKRGVSKRNFKYYGLMFRIPGLEPFVLSVEIDWRIYYGITDCDKNDLGKQELSRIGDKLQEAFGDDHGFSHYRHVIYRYLPGMEEIFFRDSEEMCDILADPDRRTEVVRTSAEELENAVRRLSR